MVQYNDSGLKKTSTYRLVPCKPHSHFLPQKCWLHHATKKTSLQLCDQNRKRHCFPRSRSAGNAGTTGLTVDILLFKRKITRWWKRWRRWKGEVKLRLLRLFFDSPAVRSSCAANPVFATVAARETPRGNTEGGELKSCLFPLWLPYGFLCHATGMALGIGQSMSFCLSAHHFVPDFKAIQ